MRDSSRLPSWVLSVHLPKPSIQDNTADVDRLLSKIRQRIDADQVTCDYRLMKRLSAILRASDYRVRCVLFKSASGWFLVDIQPDTDTKPVLGLAVDVGTTRVALRLIDLISGLNLAESTFDNPQIQIGPDVLTRIHHADQPDGIGVLQALIVSEINLQTGILCRNLELRPQDIYLMTVAGNTAMTHLFLGLEPRWLIREPYIPVSNRPDVLPASTVGIRIHPSGQVFVFPNIGSYFGGDLVSGILFSGLNHRKDTAILVDVGTNAEVVLGNRSWMIACAGAAGPALEGGVTQMGMTAGRGVIDRVIIHSSDRRMEYHTIDNAPPKGICGSGLIDLAAQLYLSGMIDIRGKLVQDKCKDRYSIQNELPAFILVPAAQSATGNNLTITQADLDSLFRSKAAMYTILETLTGTVGMTPQEIKTFYIAGTFGYFINPVSAITIGMIPDLPLSRYHTLGNSSLEGASMLLTDPSRMDEINSIQKNITYMELNVNMDFMNRFSAAKFVPHTHTGLFPSVSVWKAEG